MTITVSLILALQVAVVCIIALVKAKDKQMRIITGICLACAVVAALAPVLSGRGMRIDLGQVAWIATGVMSVIAGVRIAEGALTSLVIAGGVLGALHAVGLVAPG